MTSAVIVGSGPNGLAAALTLARAGVEVTVIEQHNTIGGGTRTSELTMPGLLHDHCSAAHPMGVASPFMQGAHLEANGVQWLHPEVPLSHPLGDGEVAVLYRSIDQTAHELGDDGRRWRQIFGPLADGFDPLAADIMGPLMRVPSHPIRLARFGLGAVLPATVLAKAWSGDAARALFGGVAAHSIHRLDRPFTSAIGLILTAVGHRYGWPVPKGGSRAITDAIAAQVIELGGRIETGRRVQRLDELGGFDVVMLDLAPKAVVGVAGDALPSRVRRAYERYRHAPGAFKIDLAIEGDIAWSDPYSARAGTVHVGGRLEEFAAAEAAIVAGRMPQHPFVLVGQQYVADPSRSDGSLNPVWAYGHVPNGYDGDATDAIIGHIERFAPGLRDRIVAQATIRTDAWADYNPNFVGGDIIGGASTSLQMINRPRLAIDPYTTGIDGVYICSASTPPGAGVHGMGGDNAARSALKYLASSR